MDFDDAFNLLDRKRAPGMAEVISTGSFAIDLALGGGLRRGRITEYYGDYMTYKTTMALHAVKQAQAIGPVLWVDSGEGFQIEHALNLGIEVNQIAVIAPVDALQALRLMRDVAAEFRLIVVDSAAQLDVPEEGEESWWDLEMDWLAEDLVEAGTTALFVNKLGIDRDNNFTRALRTAAYSRVNTIPAVGRHNMQAVVTKNSCTRPFVHEILLNFDNEAVIDPNYEIARLAVATGVVDKHGSFYQFDGGRTFHGIPGFRDALDKDPQLVADVKRAVAAQCRA